MNVRVRVRVWDRVSTSTSTSTSSSMRVSLTGPNRPTTVGFRCVERLLLAPRYFHQQSIAQDRNSSILQYQLVVAQCRESPGAILEVSSVKGWAPRESLGCTVETRENEWVVVGTGGLGRLVVWLTGWLRSIGSPGWSEIGRELPRSFLVHHKCAGVGEYPDARVCMYLPTRGPEDLIRTYR